MEQYNTELTKAIPLRLYINGHWRKIQISKIHLYKWNNNDKITHRKCSICEKFVEIDNFNTRSSFCKDCGKTREKPNHTKVKHTEKHSLHDANLTKNFISFTQSKKPLMIIQKYIIEEDFNTAKIKSLFKYIGVQELILTKAFNIVVREFDLARENFKPTNILLNAINTQTKNHELKFKCINLKNNIKIGNLTVTEIEIPWYFKTRKSNPLIDAENNRLQQIEIDENLEFL